MQSLPGATAPNRESMRATRNALLTFAVFCVGAIGVGAMLFARPASLGDVNMGESAVGLTPLASSGRYLEEQPRLEAGYRGMTVSVASERGEPIAGATACLSLPDGKASTAATDHEGRARLGGDFEGNAGGLLLVKAVGYSQGLQVLSGALPENVSVILRDESGKAIRGTVKTIGGKAPGLGMRVLAWPSHYKPTQEALHQSIFAVPVLPFADVAFDGSFEIGGLDGTGDLSLAVGARGWASQVSRGVGGDAGGLTLTVFPVALALVMAQEENGTIPPPCFPHAHTENSARPVPGAVQFWVGDPTAALCGLYGSPALSGDMDWRRLALMFLIPSDDARGEAGTVAIGYSVPGYERAAGNVPIHFVTDSIRPSIVYLHRMVGGFGDIELRFEGGASRGVSEAIVECEQRQAVSLNLRPMGGSSADGIRCGVPVHRIAMAESHLITSIPAGVYEATWRIGVSDVVDPRDGRASHSVVVQAGGRATVTFDTSRLWFLHVRFFSADNHALDGADTVALRVLKPGGSKELYMFNRTPCILVGTGSGEFQLERVIGPGGVSPIADPEVRVAILEAGKAATLDWTLR